MLEKKIITFTLVCNAKNLEEADSILDNCLKSDSTIELHGNVLAGSIGIYSESATMILYEECSDIKQKISSMINNDDISIEDIEISEIIKVDTKEIVKIINDELKKAKGNAERYKGGRERFLETLMDSDDFYNDAHSQGEVDAIQKILSRIQLIK